MQKTGPSSGTRSRSTSYAASRLVKQARDHEHHDRGSFVWSIAFMMCTIRVGTLQHTHTHTYSIYIIYSLFWVQEAGYELRPSCLTVQDVSLHEISADLSEGHAKRGVRSVTLPTHTHAHSYACAYVCMRACVCICICMQVSKHGLQLCGSL